MDRIRASLDSVLATASEQSRSILPAGELAHLGALVAQMVQRYPSQELEQSLEGYLWDFERLAAKYSLAKVEKALAELRIKPGQKFFPRPDEVAEEIEAQMQQSLRKASQSDGQRYLEDLERWKKEHAEFMREKQEGK